MAFTIHFQTKPPHRGYDDHHEIVVKEHGLLEVRKDGEQVALYSPGYWAYVTPGMPEEKTSGAVVYR